MIVPYLLQGLYQMPNPPILTEKLTKRLPFCQKLLKITVILTKKRALAIRGVVLSTLRNTKGLLLLAKQQVQFVGHSPRAAPT